MSDKVAILMGSPNDRDKMQPAVDTLERSGIEAAETSLLVGQSARVG